MGALGQPYNVDPNMPNLGGGALNGVDPTMAMMFGVNGPQSPYAKKLDEAASQVLGDPSALNGALSRFQDEYDTAKNSKLAAIKRAAALISGSRGTANLPLMAFGSGLLQNAGTFATSLGNAFGAMGPAIERQREQERLIAQGMGNLDIAGADTELQGALQKEGALDKRLQLSSQLENSAARAQGQSDNAYTRNLASQRSTQARITAAEIAADKGRYRPTNQVTEDGHYAVYLDTKTGQNVFGPPVQPKQTGGNGSVKQMLHDAWLKIHPGDEAGAIDAANGSRKLRPQELMRSAQTLALRELGAGADPADIDARAQEYYEKMSHPPGAEPAAAPPAGNKPAAGSAPPAGNQALPPRPANVPPNGSYSPSGKNWWWQDKIGAWKHT